MCVAPPALSWTWWVWTAISTGDQDAVPRAGDGPSKERTLRLRLAWAVWPLVPVRPLAVPSGPPPGLGTPQHSSSLKSSAQHSPCLQEAHSRGGEAVDGKAKRSPQR